MNMPEIVVVIPALNEESAISNVLAHIPRDVAAEIVVVDNNSSDATAKIAHKFGATVVSETRQGYGYACLKGIEYIMSRCPKADIVVFLDADYSDYPEEITELIKPIIEQNYDMVLGSRLLGRYDKGAMPWHQILGNRLSTAFINALYNVNYTDLGPFRAIKFDKLLDLHMTEKRYGWTAEMQAKAAKQRLRCLEVPVSYRARIGTSKISGTVKGTLCAGYSILATLLKNRWAYD
jgi:glycosyltransferase involved in cell wall biosynthesis